MEVTQFKIGVPESLRQGNGRYAEDLLSSSNRLVSCTVPSVVTNGPAKAVFSFQLPSDGDEPLFSLYGHDRLPRGSCSELCAEWLQQSRKGCNFCAHGLTASPVTPIGFSGDYGNLTPLPAPTDQLTPKQPVDGSNLSGGVYDEATPTKTSWNGSNGLWSPSDC